MKVTTVQPRMVLLAGCDAVNNRICCLQLR